MNIKRIMLSAVLSAGMIISAAGCSLFGQSGASTGNVGDITFSDGDKIAVIEIQDYGTMKAKLFPDIAPIGVENFIELAQQGYYNGLKIHRVVKDSVIQGGSLNGDGTGGTAAYTGEKADSAAATTTKATTFPLETSDKAHNFYGALGYAHDGYGENAVQFYIVSSKTPQDITKTDPDKVKAKADELASAAQSSAASSTSEAGTAEAKEESPNAKLNAYKQQYYSANAAMLKAKNKEEVAKKYSQVGGIYQIDGGYTVFGQIFEGFDVLDQIASVDVQTNTEGEKSLPMKDIIISSITIETYKTSTAEATAEAGSKPTDSSAADSKPADNSPDANSGSATAEAPAQTTVQAAPATAEAAAQITAQATTAEAAPTVDTSQAA